MNTAPSFDLSLLGVTKTKLDAAYWPTVIKTFEAKNYPEAFLATLRYIDKSIVDNMSTSGLTEFKIPHGSTEVNISLKDNRFTVSAPFVKVPAQGGLPMLRQLTDINFNILILTQIVLKADELWFEFSCPLEMTDPYKVYDIFREICNNADYYDDMFIEKFGATRIVQVKAAVPAQTDLDSAWDKFQKYLKEADDYIAYFEGRRLYGFCWDMINLTLMRIDYFAGTQGYVKTEIEKTIYEMGAQMQINELVAKGKVALDKLKTYDKAKFQACIYRPNVFISPKTSTDLVSVQNNLRTFYDRSKNEIANSDIIGGTLSLMYGIMNLYFRNDIPPELSEILNAGMLRASGQDWKVAADELWKAVNTVMEMSKPTV